MHNKLRILLAAVLMAGAAGWAAPAIVRGPYLQMVTDSSALVIWRSAGELEAVLRYGEGKAFDQVAKSILVTEAEDLSGVRDSVRQHRGQLTGLRPDTAYGYRIEVDGKALAAGSFRTHPKLGDKKDFRMWVLGESGQLGAPQRAVYAGFRQWLEEDGKPLAGMLHLGGMAGKDGTNREFQQHFFDVYGDLLAGTACWPVLGNEEAHTASTSKGTGPYYEAFALPQKGEAGGRPSGTESYYSFDYGRVHFVMLNSAEENLAADGPMAKWLKADLAAASSQQFLVACWHHAPYTQGTVDSDFHLIGTQTRRNWMPILEKAGVDLVLTSYSGIYERSGLINDAYNAQSIAARVTMDGGDGDPEGDGAYRKPPGLVGHQGTVAVVLGNGGKPLGMRDFHPVMLRRMPEFGSFALELRGDVLHGFMLGHDGRVRDAFAIDKSGDFPKRKFSNELPIIDRGAGWYYGFNNAGGPNWHSEVDNDSEIWELGQAGFGYGDGDDATKLGHKMIGSLNSVRIRTTFNIDRVDDVKILRFEIDYDDGFAAWLNGVEIARRNHPLDHSPPVNQEAGIFECFEVPLDLLRKGRNILAVEGINATDKSTDFSLHPALHATPKAAK